MSNIHKFQTFKINVNICFFDYYLLSEIDHHSPYVEVIIVNIKPL